MYILVSLLILVLLMFLVLNYMKKNCIIQKICSMTIHEKCYVLNTITKPMGFRCLPRQDIFTSTRNAWQRNLGYHSLYNKSAAHFNMVFDCQPIYFDYAGRTWLIELWKGQYGINTGCEVGIYYANRILSENELHTTLFQAVSDDDMLKLAMSLTRNGQPLLHLSDTTWWLTGFSMGVFSWPFQLDMEVTITFPNCTMMNAFLSGLTKYTYSKCDYEICGLSLSFHMCPFQTRTTWIHQSAIYFSQWKNRWFCRIFLFVTRHFCRSYDRLLYLYYFLPSAFRKTMQIRRYKRKYIRHCKCRRI